MELFQLANVIDIVGNKNIYHELNGTTIKQIENLVLFIPK